MGELAALFYLIPKKNSKKITSGVTIDCWKLGFPDTLQDDYADPELSKVRRDVAAEYEDCEDYFNSLDSPTYLDDLFV